MNLVKAARERFNISIRYLKTQQLIGEKRKYMRDIMLQDD